MAFQVHRGSRAQPYVGTTPGHINCYLAAIQHFFPDETQLDFLRIDPDGTRVFRSYWYGNTYEVKRV